jgi:hypothetical protein
MPLHTTCVLWPAGPGPGPAWSWPWPAGGRCEATGHWPLAHGPHTTYDARHPPCPMRCMWRVAHVLVVSSGRGALASPGAVAICYIHEVFLRHGTSGVRFGLFGFRSKQWDLQTMLLGRVGRPLVSQSKEGTTTSAAHCNERGLHPRKGICIVSTWHAVRNIVSTDLFF